MMTGIAQQPPNQIFFSIKLPSLKIGVRGEHFREENPFWYIFKNLNVFTQFSHKLPVLFYSIKFAVFSFPRFA
jgi:hypothetical protein